MAGEVNPREVEPLSSSEFHNLGNRLYERYEGRDRRVLKKDGSITIEPPYEPTLEDVTRLFRMVHDLQQFKSADERNWHEEMFRRMDSAFYRDESRLLHASLADTSARIMRTAALALLDELTEDSAGLGETPAEAKLREEIAHYDEVHDKYFTDRGLPKPDETPFLDRLRALIADEEVRQGRSTGVDTHAKYKEGREELTSAQYATLKRESEERAKEDDGKT